MLSEVLPEGSDGPKTAAYDITELHVIFIQAGTIQHISEHRGE